MTNGITKKTQQVEVSGVFAARSPQDPYWLLAPELADGVEPGGHTYGPLVLDRADFFAGWSYLGSSGWVATPDLSRAEGPTSPPHAPPPARWTRCPRSWASARPARRRRSWNG
ncbi:hypothetical protein ACFQZ4_43385 [Catellatospora coxensis]